MFAKNVRKLRNSEQGRSVFIMANGPSLLNHDLSRLKGELIIGMNASPMLEEKYDFQTSYYALSDHRFINHPEKRQWATSRLNAQCVRILRNDLRQFDDPTLARRTCYVQALSRDGFSENLHAGFYFGCTTSMLAIQLAHYLGCKKIYLLGCELRYSADSPRFYEEKDSQLEDSFTSVQIHNIANARAVLEAKGVEMSICSERSFLRPYIQYTEFNKIWK